MTRILLVNSKAADAGALASGFRSRRADWQVLVAENVDDCTSRISDESVDCLLADTTTLVTLNTEDLVRQCRAVSPSTILLLLTHDASEQTIVDDCRANLRSIDKNAGNEQLVDIVDRCLQLQQTLNNQSLSAAVSQIKHLPSLPVIYRKLSDEVSAKDSSAYSVSLIIETDSALSATVLRIVNSAFYGLNRPVESVSQAVSLLGVHMIKNITFTTKVFSQFSGNKIDQKRLEAHNENANRLGALSNHFARLAGVSREVVDQAQIAGMLDGVGELILLSEPELRVTGNEAGQPSQATLLSAYLLRFWLMPETIVEAIALKHQLPDKRVTQIDPLVIASAILYLDKHLTHVENEQLLRQCTEQLATWVSERLADKWIQAYCDMKQLVLKKENA